MTSGLSDLRFAQKPVFNYQKKGSSNFLKPVTLRFILILKINLPLFLQREEEDYFCGQTRNFSPVCFA